MDELIARLEAATGPDRELDAAIWIDSGRVEYDHVAVAENYKGQRLYARYQKGYNDGGMGDGYWWNLKGPADRFRTAEKALEAAKYARGHQWEEAKPDTIATEQIHRGPVPSYTASIDAALTLLGDSPEYEITTLYGVARVGVNLNHGQDSGPSYGERIDGNVPIALCIAALKARA